MHDSDVTIEEMAADAQQGWGGAYGRFAAVLETHDLRRGVEIGVAFGGHAESLLAGTNVEQLWAVDPYRHQGGYDDPVNVPQWRFDEMHAFTTARLGRFGSRCVLVRATSQDAATTVPDGIDFAYIDAAHTCESVWDDLVRWHAKVRPGGIIGGHDYGHVNFPGVKTAIDAFSERTGWQLHDAGESVWWMPRGDLAGEEDVANCPCVRETSGVSARVRAALARFSGVSRS